MKIEAEAYGKKWVRVKFTGRECVYAVKPHEDALLFDCEKEGEEYNSIVSSRMKKEIDKGKEGILSLMKQFALVNLFYFEKFILGPFGPWDKLTDSLHLDMCNFCQSDYVLGDGAHSGLAIGRGHFKSTVRTTGLGAWLLVRDPNIKIAIISSVFDFASRFLKDIRTVFEVNELVRLFWPSMMWTGKTTWNDTTFYSPGRTKAASEGSVTAKGIGGASASQHFDYILVDDPISAEDLNKEMSANSDMEGKKKWLATSLPPLVMSPMKSCILWTFTFYSLDDCYMEQIVPRVYALFGFLDEAFIEEKDKGKYAMYWRPTLQDGEPIFPETISLRFLEEMMENDPWMFQTQYQNRPMAMESSTLKDFDIGECFVFLENGEVDGSVKESTLLIYKKVEGVVEHVMRFLKHCYVIMTVDWAASKKTKDEKKSKTSVQMWAITPFNERCLIDGWSGRGSSPEVFKKIFFFAEKWRDYMQTCVVETNAMQLGVKQLLEEKKQELGKFFNIDEDCVRGDKEVRIKVNFGSQLMQGNIYAGPEMRSILVGEKNLFGSVKGMFDNLDCAEKAQRWLKKPLNGDDVQMLEFGSRFQFGNAHEEFLDDEFEDKEFWLEMDKRRKGAVHIS
jgi:hypothetical protein